MPSKNLADFGRKLARHVTTLVSPGLRKVHLLAKIMCLAFTHTRYSLAGDTPEALGLDALNTWQSGVFHAWSHPTQGMFALKAL